MFIGVDASRAFLKRRTGIEEYAYQTIKHLRDVLSGEHHVVLYVRKKLQITGYKLQVTIPDIDFDLPKHWMVKGLWAPRFWTQIRLSLEMLLHSPDVLFVPAHTVPVIHPSKTVVTIHGLEYELCPEAYPFFSRLYMRLCIRFSCRAASAVVCVSENTKKDIVRLYQVPEKKIRVVYEGYDEKVISHKPQVTNEGQNKKPYLLFIGRLEERKNVVRMIEAFEILKEQYRIPHQLLLVGKPGYRYEKIKNQKSKIKNGNDVVEVGYVDDEEKWSLLKNADIFLFPTLYEGFGIPVLEAQAAGVPVVTSSVASLPEVGGEGAVYVDPMSAGSIVEGIQKLISGRVFRDGIITKGEENMKRFGWGRCAGEIAKLLTQ